MNYYLRSVDYKSIAIEFGQEVLSHLNFRDLTSSEAKMYFPKADYSFGRATFWSRTVTIKKNGIPIGTIKRNWKEEVFIDIQKEDKTPIAFVMTYRGVFDIPRKEVFLADQLIMTMRIKKGKVEWGYEIDFHIPKEMIPYPIEELLGILAFGSSYQVRG